MDQRLLPEEQSAQPLATPADAGGAPRTVVMRQIAFALSELSSENAAHRFEDLCRHLARARLAANVLPAAGPVGAGGDQGRDFETYRTYLTAQLGPHGGFAARVPDGTVAFACTLQQRDLASKVREDVGKVCGGGVPVEAVYCFLAVPMAVGVRHKIQDEILEAHGVHVEILDRAWLAEELADPELFWIAEEYLSLPATLAPARPPAPHAREEPQQWYMADRDRWRARGAARPTLGELLDLRDGLRHATFNREARADLPFWLSLMEPLCGADGRLVRQRARYETAVAQMRGLKDLRPADRHVADFFTELGDEPDPARLSDAGVLLTYASVAYSFAQSDLELEQLKAWGDALRAQVAALLNDDPPPVRRARLLEVLGQLFLARDPGSLGRASKPIELPEVAELVDEDGHPLHPMCSPGGSELFVDVPAGLRAWGELAASLAELPLFPVDAMARSLELLSPLLVGEDGWSAIVAAVDAAVARAEGDAAAGDRALGRAQALYDGDRRLEALDELHTAKVRFFHGDHPRSLALTLLALADLYGELHLPLAARQHALAAAKAAHASEADEVTGLVPHALFLASEHDYRAGSFASALQVLVVAVLAQQGLVDAEVDAWADRDFSCGVFTAGMCLKSAHDLLAGPFVDSVDELLGSVGMLDQLRELSVEMPAWSALEWASRADAQLEGRPYADVGERREIRFSALGLSWTISSDNAYLDVAAAERLAAAAQVLCADLADHELVLLPTEVAIDIELRPPGDPIEPAERLSAAGRRWVAELSSVDEGQSLEPDQVTQELLTIMVSVLMEVSLLPKDEFMAVIEQSFAKGITHKLCPVRPYDELIPYGQNQFDSLPRRTVSAPLAQARPSAKYHSGLAWRSTPGPGYSLELAREMLATRYEQLPALMPITLRALRGDRRFATTVLLLRKRGWLDWHILTAIFNLSLQVRLGRAGLNRVHVQRTEQGRQAAKDLAFTPEAEDDPPVPLAPLLNLERLDEGRQMALPSLMVHWGLDLHARQFDIEAAEQLLAERYGYWTDDIDHRDPFAA